MARTLIQFPVTAVWNKPDGGDAHVVDTAGNIVVDGAEWQDKTVTADEHRGAMVFIAMAINARWRCNQNRLDRENAAVLPHIGKFHNPVTTHEPKFY